MGSMEITQRCSRCKKIKSLDDYSPSYRGKAGTWCRSCFASYNRGDCGPSAEHDPRKCETCGTWYTPRQIQARGARYCSVVCKDNGRNTARARRTLASKALRQCLHCAGAIEPHRRSHAIFCSAVCNSNAHALQRKLRARTGQDGKPGYLRALICERDRWRCQLCNRFVNRTAEHPDPLSPSLDHIIAVSAGGGNEPDNLQLTHLVCNLRRRNLPIEVALEVLSKRKVA